jgi:hypothetical protein
VWVDIGCKTQNSFDVPATCFDAPESNNQSGQDLFKNVDAWAQLPLLV